MSQKASQALFTYLSRRRAELSQTFQPDFPYSRVLFRPIHDLKVLSTSLLLFSPFKPRIQSFALSYFCSEEEAALHTSSTLALRFLYSAIRQHCSPNKFRIATLSSFFHLLSSTSFLITPLPFFFLHPCRYPHPHPHPHPHLTPILPASHPSPKTPKLKPFTKSLISQSNSSSRTTRYKTTDQSQLSMAIDLAGKVEYQHRVSAVGVSVVVVRLRSCSICERSRRRGEARRGVGVRVRVGVGQDRGERGKKMGRRERIGRVGGLLTQIQLPPFPHLRHENHCIITSTPLLPISRTDLNECPTAPSIILPSSPQD